ncbi:MAG TPA: hypothetical protein VHG51_10830 [Longimicrobiaceae bacterium]|nr:hypothetical protein [Longimicrobiaceae bacterium]
MSVRGSRTRRWRVPPAPAQPQERLVGAQLLQESEGELATLLWRSLRAVSAWAATPPADRALLFAPGARDQRMADLLAAAPPAALERPLRALADLLGDPAGASPDRVGIACLSVAAWAREAGKPTTALEFTHVGALACPGSPSYALAAARESRDAGESGASEAMYHRAVALARQVCDWDSYVRAHAGLGKLAQARGVYPGARKSLLRALRAAERRSLGYLRAMVLHDLFTVEVDCDRAAEAERYAEAAADAYGRGHGMAPRLAFDVAVFWMSRGRFREALPVFLRTLHAFDADGQLLGWGTVARSAGAVGDEAAFERAYERVAAAPASLPRKVDALRDAAQGAIHLGRPTQAEEAARRALLLAGERGEHKNLFVLEAVLEQAAALRAGTRARGRVAPEPESRVESPLFRKLDGILGAVPV